MSDLRQPLQELMSEWRKRVVALFPDDLTRRAELERCVSQLDALVRAASPPAPPNPDDDYSGCESLAGSLTLRHLQTINAKRAARWHKGGLTDWSALEWAGAMAGEAGEACNAAKKLKRIEDGIANINNEEGRSLTDKQNAALVVADEVADTIIYGVLLAERVGLDIEEAVRLKFNKKSEEYGFPERLSAGGVRRAATGDESCES